MPLPISCVDCGVTLTTQDALADQVVQDDEGFHHLECADGDSPTRPASAEEVAVAEREGDLTPKQIEEENERRAEMGDPPLPQDPLTGVFPCKPFSVAGPRPGPVIYDDFAVLSGGRISEGAYRATEGFEDEPSESGPRCPECGDPVDEPGRCFTCRGRSMLP